MPLKVRAFLRNRPRILTLVILVHAALVIALANLGFDQAYNEDVCAIYQSYGWPIVWHRLVRSNWNNSWTFHTVGWYYSAPRLAVSLVIWLTILAALGAGCEWLLRRHARPHWSIRTMLIGVAAAAIAFLYISVARHTPLFEQAHQTLLFGNHDGVLSAVLAIVAAPVFEEFIFRGLIFGGLRRSMELAGSVLASAGIFAIVHPPASVIPVFGLGVATALVYERTKLLIGPITAHAAYNALIVGYQLVA